MDPNRTIRAPSTIIKPPKLNVYSGPLAQSKFRLLNSASSSLKSNTTGSSVMTTASSAPRNYQQCQPTSSTKTIIASQPNVTNRPVSKLSGIVKPSPTRQVISATSTTSSLRQPTANKPMSLLPAPQRSQQQRSIPKISALKASQQSTTVNNFMALNDTIRRPNPELIDSGLKSKTNISSVQIDNSIFESATDDIHEMRRLLEQLVNHLQNPQESTEALREENRRLKHEIAELRQYYETSSIANNRDRQTVIKEETTNEACPRRDHLSTGSSVFFSPMK